MLTPLASRHSPAEPVFGLMVEVNNHCVMCLTSNLIEQLDRHVTTKRPPQEVIIFSMHHTHVHRHMCSSACTTSISVHTEAHLVAMDTSVEDRGILAVILVLNIV